jgi:hypothetical protein
MKKTIRQSAFILALLAISTMAFLGCKTTSNPTGTVAIGSVTLDPAATGKAVRIAAKLGTIEGLRQSPESRPYLLVAAATIDAAIATGQYTPSTIEATLAEATGNNVAGQAIADALDLYADFFGKLTSDKLEAQSPYTVPVLTGLAQGIREGLATP